MDTPFTIRAKELRDIYNSINMKYLTQDERLDVLLTLKHTVKVRQQWLVIVSLFAIQILHQNTVQNIMKKQMSMTSKYYNHRPQSNPLHCEQETLFTNSENDIENTE